MSTRRAYKRVSPVAFPPGGAAARYTCYGCGCAQTLDVGDLAVTTRHVRCVDRAVAVYEAAYTCLFCRARTEFVDCVDPCAGPAAAGAAIVQWWEAERRREG